jgi:hypothetical protein
VTSSFAVLSGLPIVSKRPTVDKTLQLFIDSVQLEEKMGSSSSHSSHFDSQVRSNLEKTIAMLMGHFDEMLPLMLLYPAEWAQHDRHCRSSNANSCGLSPRPAEVYGVG